MRTPTVRHAFTAYGIELEYMIVDRETLSACPIAGFRILAPELKINQKHAFKGGRQLAAQKHPCLPWKRDSGMSTILFAHIFAPQRGPIVLY